MTGYILIDLSGIDLAAESAATVAGTHAKLSEAISTNKPIIVEGLVNGTTVISPVSVLVYTDTYGIEVEFNTTKITVSSADSVSISSLIPEPETNTTKSTKSTK
jgi:hypothetical protein